ncbi:prepilin-type N-terminal cleavage/methylation domain-containing protein [Paraneptunicella aestuarii]|uniref:type II secretion system protein n=1 Tax=Paraneptunicella aestuarii TaxID=2831148 RepID=UPI001E530A65|nr:prepilin-type N-terminal cleavage/methylation domain-containing protein [Paraneptunicella aestuarii]UAA39651.1 prepilin-type N-terminal cleavage/methylation domain-containing protein [Paraneptunicella aestuarii]
MNASRLNLGFSLIELLVVFMVMSLVLSIVGPSINKVYTQHMAQQEMRMLKQYVRDISVYAYSVHEDINIRVSGDRIEAFFLADLKQGADELVKPLDETLEYSEEGDIEQSPLFSHRFEYLQFDNTRFRALKSGVVTLDFLRAAPHSQGIFKDIAIKGIAYSETWQG